MRAKPDMTDVLIMDPNIPAPPLVPRDLKRNWCWCRFGAHWFRTKGTTRRSDACKLHENAYWIERQRRKVQMAQQMEETEGAGKNGLFCENDYYYQVFCALSMRSTRPWPDAPAEAKDHSSLNLPSADDELACGCVPGWPHGPKCYDGLTGAPCTG